MAERKKLEILFLGGAGFIGGVVLERMLSHPSVSQFNLSALVRSKAKAPLFEQVGVTPIVGSLEDGDLMSAICSEADYIFSIADCDDVEGIKFMLSGMKARFERTGEKPILIHTSGSGLVTDKAQGDFASEKIYSDLDLQQLDSLPDDQPHRPVDLLILEADRQGIIDAFIVVPSVTFGIANGKLAKMGLQRCHSIPFRVMSECFVQRGQAGMIGQGRNIWPLVHVDELTDLYMMIFDGIRSNWSAVSHGKEGYYFAENGEFPYYVVYKAYAEAMAARGIGTDEPTTLGDDDNIPAVITTFWGTNSRFRADRARSIGWEPRKNLDDLLATIPFELDAHLASLKGSAQ